MNWAFLGQSGCIFVGFINGSLIDSGRVFCGSTLGFFPLKLQGIVAEIPSDSATSSRGRFLLFLC